MTPSLLYVKVDNLSFLILFSYVKSLKPGMSLVAPLWTFSITSTWHLNLGAQTELAYSKCGLSNALYRRRKNSSYRCMNDLLIRPAITFALLCAPHNEVVGGYIGFHPSVRPVSRVYSVAPTVLVGSISYLHILSSNFRRSVACKVYCKIFLFFLICNFDFVLFWLGIWCESLVWVIMGRRGVSQNAGVLVVLVNLIWYMFIKNQINIHQHPYLALLGELWGKIR